MELNEKKLRKLLDEIVTPRFDSLSREVAVIKEDLTGVKEDLTGVKEDVSGVKKDIIEMKADIAETKEDIYYLKNKFDEFDKRLLDLEEKMYPEMASFQDQFKIVLDELDDMKKSGGDTFVRENIKRIDDIIAEKSRKLLKLTAEVEKIKENFKKFKQSQKRKIA